MTLAQHQRSVSWGGAMVFTLKIRALRPHRHLSPARDRTSWQEVSLGFLSLPWSLSDWLLHSSQPSQPWETYGKGALITEALGSRGEWERESSVCERDLYPKPDQRFPFCCGDVETCPCRAVGGGDQANKAGVTRREPVIRRGNWATGQVSHGLAVITLTKSSLFGRRTKPPL